MRAGILVLGPLLAKFGKAKVSFQVAVQLELDLLIYIYMLYQNLGVNYKIIQGYVYAKAQKD